MVCFVNVVQVNVNEINQSQNIKNNWKLHFNRRVFVDEDVTDA